ncbi:MAG: TonB-dependent receptor family protein [Hyphomicrobiaceae bacterium]
MRSHQPRRPAAAPQAVRPRTILTTVVTLGALSAIGGTALAQSSSVPLPGLVVETSKAKAKSAKRPAAQPKAAAPAAAAQPPELSPTGAGGPITLDGRNSLTVPTTAEIQAELARVPGAVVVVPDAAYKLSTPATTMKDVLDYVPGVFVQPKWGEDSRLSIRGSGLSRNFHLRSVQLFEDGIPRNTADGYGDFQEIDPSAYRYVEVYKGSNALRFGANALGGAINFVTPTGRDANRISASADIGSFGFHRLQSSIAGANGPFDLFVTASWQEQDGFRDHSWGESKRGSGNIGIRLSEDVETRFYFGVSDIMQRIPGSVTRAQALSDPKAAAAINVANDWQRNIDAWRVANKTTIKLAPGTAVEFGAFYNDRHLMHPIFQWLDYQYEDYGGFARIVDDRIVGGYRNRLIAGLQLHNGKLDNRQYANGPGASKGALISSSLDRSENLAAYLENAFYFLPDVALVTGTQFLHATRDRENRVGSVSGSTAFDLWSPKVGLLWDIDRTWQAFINISRSGEVPSFGESSSAAVPAISFTDIKAQRATTYEIGTRGRRPDVTWDLAVYRMEISNELQCLYSAFGSCQVVNADQTVHQGIEVGFGLAVLKGMAAPGPSPDRLWLNLSYTLNDFRFDDDEKFGDNLLPGAPRHFVRAELLYRHPSGVFFGPNMEWVPQAYYVDSANTLKTAAYAIWGLKLGFDNGGPLSAYVEGRNLSDKAYIASASIIDVAQPTSALFEPGTGRAVFAGVKYRW